MEFAMKPRILITNDDGIDSFFLRTLIEAHQAEFEVYVAAPLREQSWISRAITREGEVQVQEDSRFGCTAWSLDGTPTDCVNIALGHLIPQSLHPVAVVSGINLGYNAAYPFILSSGTISGALEGLMWGLPGIAYSQMIPEHLYETLRTSHGAVEGAFAESVAAAGKKACELTRSLLREEHAGITVHNINFPIETTHETSVERTIPERFHCGTLFQPTAPNRYQFKFTSKLTPLINTENTDRACLLRGHISYTQLDYGRLCAES